MADDQEQQIHESVSDNGLEPEAATPAAERPAPKAKRRRRGFRSGLVFGILAGLVVSVLLRPKGAGEQPAEGQPAADAESAIDGLRSRLREAADEAREAAHEAEEAKRARFSELLERE